MVVVRNALLNDSTAIAHVVVQSWQSTYRGIVPDEFLDNLSVANAAPRMAEMLREAGDNGIALVAEDDGRVVGMATTWVGGESGPDYDAELAMLYVLDAYHGRGVGRALIEETCRRLIARDITSMMCWVLVGNLATAFYERLGARQFETGVFDRLGFAVDSVAYGWSDITPLVRQPPE